MLSSIAPGSAGILQLVSRLASSTACRYHLFNSNFSCLLHSMCKPSMPVISGWVPKFTAAPGFASLYPCSRKYCASSISPLRPLACALRPLIMANSPLPLYTPAGFYGFPPPGASGYCNTAAFPVGLPLRNSQGCCRCLRKSAFPATVPALWLRSNPLRLFSTAHKSLCRFGRSLHPLLIVQKSIRLRPPVLVFGGLRFGVFCRFPFCSRSLCPIFFLLRLYLFGVFLGPFPFIGPAGCCCLFVHALHLSFCTSCASRLFVIFLHLLYHI